MAANENTSIYPRNRVLTTLMVVNTMLFALCGIMSISSGGAVLSMVWFGGAVLFYINFLWSKKTAFIQFTDESLTMFPAMARPQRIIPWGTIASLQRVSDFKAMLKLKNGEHIRLGLFALNKEDRIPLLNNLEKRITDAA